MIDTALMPLERDALEMLLSDENCDEGRLKSQVGCATVKRREFTGAGVIVELDVPGQAADAQNQSRTVANLCGTMAGLRNGFGGVLFLENGKIQTLELFTHNEKWPEAPAKYTLELVDVG
jgi:hypothetical protein